MPAVTVDRVDAAFSLSETIEELRSIAESINEDPRVVDADLMERVEEHFAHCVDMLWAMNPSEVVDGFIRTLRGFPVKLDEWFRVYLIQNEKAIPPMDFVGPVRIWICPSY